MTIVPDARLVRPARQERCGHNDYTTCKGESD